MLTLVHTADVHLDTPFTGSGLTREQAVQRRSDLLTSFRRVIELAKERSADVLLIAGDLFEEEYLTVATLRRTFGAITELAPMPVIVSPGNHDPFHSTSPWATEELPENLHLFRGESIEKVSFPDLNLTIWGTAFTRHHHTDRRWQGFKVSCNGRHIICTHGAFYKGEAGQAEKYLPIAEEDLLGSGADYIALGHYHNGFDAAVDRFTGSVHAAYPGSPEPMQKNSQGTHCAIVATIDDEKNVAIERVPTQVRAFHKIELDVSDCADIAAIDKMIVNTLAAPELADNLVNLSLRGRVPSEVHIDPVDYAEYGRRLFSLSIIDETLPDYDLDAIAAEQTARGAFCRLLSKRLEAAETTEEKEIFKDALYLGLAAFENQPVVEFPI